MPPRAMPPRPMPPRPMPPRPMPPRPMPPRPIASRVTSSAEPQHRNAGPSSSDPSCDPSARATLREIWTGARAGRVLRARRLALAVPSLVTAGGLAWLAALAYPAGVSPLAWAVLVLFSLVMGWQAFVACQYAYGLVADLLADRAKSALERHSEDADAVSTGEGRTAAVVAIHAEDAVAVFARLRVMARSLAGRRRRRHRHLRLVRHARRGDRRRGRARIRPASRPGPRPTRLCRGSATGAGPRMSAARPATSANSAAATVPNTPS